MKAEQCSEIILFPLRIYKVNPTYTQPQDAEDCLNALKGLFGLTGIPNSLKLVLNDTNKIYPEGSIHITDA